MAGYEHSDPPLFSWLQSADVINAAKSAKKAMPSISSIIGPFGLVDPQYPKVNFKYFNRKKSTGTGFGKCFW